MKKSSINVEISLDENSIPEKIQWQADDMPDQGWQESKAISISIWDPQQHDSLSLDLWTKEMNVDDMKKFYINLLGSAASTILSATGDEIMSEKLKSLCDELVEHVKFQ